MKTIAIIGAGVLVVACSTPIVRSLRVGYGVIKSDVAEDTSHQSLDVSVRPLAHLDPVVDLTRLERNNAELKRQLAEHKDPVYDHWWQDPAIRKWIDGLLAAVAGIIALVVGKRVIKKRKENA